MLSLRSLASHLVDAGHSVLTYDFFGVGGHSDAPSAPEARYDLEYFLDTLQQLLAVTGLEERPLRLVGYSMGCGVAAALAARRDLNVERVSLLDPVHGPVEFLGEVVQTPGVGAVVGNLAAAAVGNELLVGHLRKEYQHPEWPHVAEFMETQFELIRATNRAKPNLVNAAVTMVQNFPFSRLLDTYRELGSCGKPIQTQVVWGDLSKYFPKRNDVESVLPGARVDVIHDAGHMLFAEKPEEMNALVAEFLS